MRKRYNSKRLVYRTVLLFFTVSRAKKNSAGLPVMYTPSYSEKHYHCSTKERSKEEIFLIPQIF